MAIANASLSESVGSLLNKVNETIVVVNDLTDGTINTDNIVADIIVIDTANANTVNYGTLSGGNITSNGLINTTSNITANNGLVSGGYVRATANLISGGDIYASDDLRVHDDLIVGGTATIGFTLTAGTIISNGRISANSSYVSANILSANSADINSATIGTASISATGAINAGVINASNVISSGDLYATDDLIVRDDATVYGILRVQESAFANNGRFYADYLNGTISVTGGNGSFSFITSSGNITANGNIVSTGDRYIQGNRIQAESADDTALGGFRLFGSVGELLSIYGVEYDLEISSGTATFDLDITRFFNPSGLYYNHCTIYISGLSFLSDPGVQGTVNQFHKSIHFGAYYSDSQVRTGGTDAWVLTTATLNDAQYNSDATNFPAGAAGASNFVTIVGGQVILRLSNDIRHASNPDSATYFSVTMRVQYV